VIVEILLSSEVPLADCIRELAVALESVLGLRPTRIPPNGELAEVANDVGCSGGWTSGHLHLLGLSFDSLVDVGLLFAMTVGEVLGDSLMINC
jgi:hypothetical protein